MTDNAFGPLSRPFPLHRVTPGGVEAPVEATAAENQALAVDLDLPAIHRLEARYRLTGRSDRVEVTGRLRASIEQICVVTLEPFPVEIDEEVEIAFATPDPRRKREDAAEVELSADEDLPDELVGEHIDLGRITAEFLALGLDPYPRRPGAAFDTPDEPVAEGPFSRLAELRPKQDDR
ncbi:YceD family protein [Enterovirga rhinocerotis]|uniref:Uncharacterized metal-binding protein YceD (DUF177 family) n=1 Tax=Enterovirga rhinocerotis TaxID=1339210 RepID=A0A4R7C6A6_9HYPH|nr:DUF177 domain-containing protein [Enterovirga rhinocerotis]TDR94110.1 uncharacterized metal-binding protein YceD (DUF177 family) [Enterovirga rhinocerotis]